METNRQQNNLQNVSIFPILRFITNISKGKHQTVESQRGLFASQQELYCFVIQGSRSTLRKDSGLAPATMLMKLRLLYVSLFSFLFPLLLSGQAAGTDVYDVVEPGMNGTYCLDLSDFNGDVVLFENTCSEISGQHVAFKLDSTNFCLNWTGLLAGGVEKACILACDKFSNCNTFLVEVRCTERPQKDTLFVPLKTGQQFELCGDTSELFTFPSMSTWDSESGSLQLVSGKPLCRRYIPKPGVTQDEVTFIACDSFGRCDTTLYLIELSPYSVEVFRDTLVIHFSEEVCPDENELPLALTTVTPVLLTPGTGAIEFNLQVSNACVTYSARAVGTDTLQLLLRDGELNTDTAMLIITCRMPEPAFVRDTLLTGETNLYCLDDSELAGALAGASNPCLSTAIHAGYQFDIQSLCLEVEAREPGIDSVCYVLCDQNGICDTFSFHFFIQFNPSVYRIGLTDDWFTLDEQGLLEADLLSNDTIPGGAEVVEIGDPFVGGLEPRFGEVGISWGANGFRMNYQALPGFCAVTDSFRYIACNTYFCDTATVYIRISCVDDPLEVHQGFSPNGDGLNDTFVIEGLSFFKNHHLLIYNRWGSQVYESYAYENDWDGSWQNTPLPDGTYFYHLEVDGGRIYRGFIELRGGR